MHEKTTKSAATQEKSRANTAQKDTKENVEKKAGEKAAEKH